LAKRLKKAQLNEETFEAIAREWHSKKKDGCSKSYADATMARLENNAFPWLGNRPIKDSTDQGPPPYMNKDGNQT
jgi:hypothetical protein